ncbi:MAG: hypothetical protein ACLSAH_00850 [Bilophila wadsworthia]
MELAGRFDVAQRIRLTACWTRPVRNSASRSFDVASFEKKRLKPREAAAPQQAEAETFPRQPMICRDPGDRGNIDAHAFHQSGYGQRVFEGGLLPADMCSSPSA